MTIDLWNRPSPQESFSYVAGVFSSLSWGAISTVYVIESAWSETPEERSCKLRTRRTSPAEFMQRVHFGLTSSHCERKRVR